MSKATYETVFVWDGLTHDAMKSRLTMLLEAGWEYQGLIGLHHWFRRLRRTEALEEKHAGLLREESSKDKVKDAIKHLLGTCLEDVHLDRDSDMYKYGDEDAPFFTEAYLYNLIGKDDARTVLAAVRKVCEAAGLSMRDLEVELDRESERESRKQIVGPSIELYP